MRREDGFVLGDAVADGAELVEELVDGELGEAVELQFEDGVNLFVTEDEGCGAGGVGGQEGGVDGVLRGVESDAAQFGATQGDALVAEVGEEVLAGVGA